MFDRENVYAYFALPYEKVCGREGISFRRNIRLIDLIFFFFLFFFSGAWVDLWEIGGGSRSLGQNWAPFFLGGGGAALPLFFSRYLANWKAIKAFPQENERKIEMFGSVSQIFSEEGEKNNRLIFI